MLDLRHVLADVSHSDHPTPRDAADLQHTLHAV